MAYKFQHDTIIDGWLEVTGDAYINFTEIESGKIRLTQTAGITVGVETRSSVSGADAVMNITHLSDTEASGARLSIGVAGDSAGDPVIGFRAGSNFWTMGLDNSDGDAWKLTNANFLSTGEAIKVTTAGAVTISGALTASNLSGTNTGDQTLNSLLPTQAGNAGEYLTTDGTNASWAAAGGGGGPSPLMYYFRGIT